MSLDDLFSPQVIIVVGKGGVGKTTVSATVAALAAKSGRRPLLIEVEGKGSLAQVFGAAPLSYKPAEVYPGVDARTITPEEALIDYFESHSMGRLSRRLAKSNVMDYIATAIPGLKDIIVLGRVKAIANERVYDTIIVDSPAAGHAVTFLTGAKAILDAVRVGPIRDQARDVAELLEDGDRCRVSLVTLPEETPVNETIETTARLEERIELTLGPLVVNAWVEAGVEPAPRDIEVARLAKAAGAAIDTATAAALAAAARFRESRRALQSEQWERLRAHTTQPILRLPFMYSAEFGRDDLDVLAAALHDQLAAGLPTG